MLCSAESRSSSIVLSKESLKGISVVKQLVIERINKPRCPPGICTPGCKCQTRQPLDQILQSDITDQLKEVIFKRSEQSNVFTNVQHEVVYFDKVQTSDAKSIWKKLPITLQVWFNQMKPQPSSPVQIQDAEEEEDVLPVYVTFVHQQQDPGKFVLSVIHS